MTDLLHSDQTTHVAKPPFTAPDDVPTDAGFTAKVGAWVADPSATDAGRVTWHAWRVNSHDDS